MRVYRNHYHLACVKTDDDDDGDWTRVEFDDGSNGFAYFTSRQEAEKHWNKAHKHAPLQDRREWIESGDRARPCDFDNTLIGIVDLLNRYADHPDNG